jgi:N-acetyl sugar amidotransferase
MDTSDPEIQFDEHGVCSHCRTYDDLVKRFVFTGDQGQQKLQQIVEVIKQDGRDKKYDCVIGVSGGVDSTYTAWLVHQLGLRPLAVHLDNGWDSELAVSNIHHALRKLDIELYTHVIDWEEFKDLQLSFLRASTPDSEIPSDHAIAALMRIMADKIGVRHILIGFNVKTETHLPRAWSRGHYDWKYIRGVHQQFGHKKLRTFPHLGFWTYKRYELTQNEVHILNYVDYRKSEAVPFLERELGWRNYGGKHFESIYTRFYQGYILPQKFGFDKRRCHLSSLICSGEISRDAALRELQNPPYPLEQQEEDKVYVLKKLGLSAEEFEALMALPKKTYLDYPNFLQEKELFNRMARQYRRVDGLQQRLRQKVFGSGSRRDDHSHID